MTRLFKNLLLFLLVVCLLVASPITAVSAQDDVADDVPIVIVETFDGETTQQTQLTEEEAAALPMPMADANYYNTLEEAAADVGAQLMAGENPVVVGVNQAYDSAKVNQIYALACAHTGQPKQGDYLANRCRGYGASISIYSASFVITYIPNYATTSQQEAQVDTKVSQILSDIRQDTPYHAVLDIFRWLRSNVTYQSGGTINHTAYGALINGKGVCESYSSAFYRLALECGVDCRIVKGDLIDGSHAWNIVELDGLYYIVDVTNDVFLRCPASVEGLLILEKDYLTEPFLSEYPMTAQDYTADILYEYDPSSSTLTLPSTGSVIDYYRDVTDLLMEQQLGGIPNPNFKYSTAPWENLMDTVTTVKMGGNPSFIPSRIFYWNQTLQSVTIPASVSLIQKNAFNSCLALRDVYFCGTQDQWDSITVESYNNALTWVTVHPNAEPLAGNSFTLAGGWHESLYAEIEGVEDADVTSVSYFGAVSGELKGQDLEYLVRNTASGVRIDIPGLKPGKYTLSVVAGDQVYSQSDVTVTAYDRSGYAHWNYTAGVGAYNDDGTIKENAVILYVTEENKNTVSLTAGGVTVSGIGNILNTDGQYSKNGSKTNGNNDILKKLADEGRPLVVRIVGRVTKPQGVTGWGSYDYGGGLDDNGGMAKMRTCKNITIEGIGEDAVVDGWGFSVGSQNGDYAAGYSRNFEFRNLTFRNVPEDCIGISGQSTGASLTEPIEHTWVHNCSFYGPSGLPDASADQDKAEGDGAVDYKWAQYHTMSYCYFEKYHKTHLLGGSDDNLQYHVTWHHNYYKNCESRGPFGRQANVHIYNNVVEGQTSYCMRATANCYIYAEYNTFINSKKVSDNSPGGMIKSYNNRFQNCTGTNVSNMVIATSRNQSVSSTNKYPNFDTNPSYGYLASGDYLLDTDLDAALVNTKTNAGAMGRGSAVEEEEPPAPEINESSYIHDFTEHGLSSSFYTISGNLSTAKGTVSYNNLTLTQCLKLESATSITFTAPTNGTLILVFHETGLNGAVAKENSVKVDNEAIFLRPDNTVVLSLSAGKHTIQRGSAQIFLYYMVFTPEAGQGAALSGSYKSFGSAGDGLTIQLFASGSEKAAYTFTNASAPANSGSWRIEGVAPGAYTLKVMKKNHVAREYPLTVSSGEASLDVEIWQLGDVNGDGLVNFSDYSKVLSQSKKPNSQILADYAFLCGDVNADGNINFSDYSKVLSQAKGKGSLWN